MATCQCYRSQTAPETLCGKPAKGNAMHNGRQYHLCGIHLKSCKFELLAKKSNNNRRAAAAAAPTAIQIGTPKRAESPSEHQRRAARPSPAVSATAVPTGTEMLGNDGRLYIVRLRADGTQYWAPCAQKTSGCRGNGARKNAPVAAGPSATILRKVTALARQLNDLHYPGAWVEDLDQRFLLTMEDLATGHPLWVLQPQEYLRLESLDEVSETDDAREYLYESRGRAVSGSGADEWVVYRDGLVPEMERLIQHYTRHPPSRD